jgi:uncharacterized phiE125 gp8 family phage protein
MNLRVITAGDQVIDLVRARGHLKLSVYGNSPQTHPDDTLVQSLIDSAHEAAEKITARKLSTTVMELRRPQFTSKIALPVSPVQSVASVKYLDGDGVEQTLSSSLWDFVDDPTDPAVYVSDFPSSVKDIADAVRVRFTAGYTDEGASPAATALPSSIVQAMLLMLAHWYEHRESVNFGNIVSEVPQSAEFLLHMHRWELGL